MEDRASTGVAFRLLTVHQGIPHQQNLVQRKISILVIHSRADQMETFSLQLMRSYSL